ASAAADDFRAHDAIALARAGTAAIESGRFGDALEAFSKATKVRPRDASLCFGAGVAAFMLGQDEVAQARFECALSRNPNLLEAAVWLGEVHYRTGHLADAISVYEAARYHPAWTNDLQQKLERWCKEQALQSRFHEAHTTHFMALFESAADEPIAGDVLDRLEAAYRRIGSVLGAYPSRPIAVVLYTRDQFEAITRLAGWSVAAYDGRIRLPLGDGLERPGELDRVLSHEYVHALVTTLGGRTVPAWMSEGLATVLEPATTAEEATPPADSLMSLTKLERGFIDLSMRDAEIAYEAGARAVKNLIDRRGMPALVALLEDLARGEPFPRAFHQRLAMRYEEFAQARR
ncbi:MAG TPA: tetratricopeptide repeat protein, partial [Vicinamibacterales bacterium]